MIFKLIARAIRLALLLPLAAGGALLLVLRGFSAIAPDVAHRLDEPFDHDDDGTWDGRQFLD